MAFTLQDDIIYDVAAKLLACLTVQVNQLDSVPANIGFLPGAAFAEDLSIYNDLCCEGTAFVRHASTYPSGENFPAPDTGQDPCSPLAWGIVFEIGVMRCAPTGSIAFVPTMAEWSAANSQYFLDMAALRAAICCYQGQYSQGDGIVIGQASPSGPQGGCIVATLTVTIQAIGCGTC